MADSSTFFVATVKAVVNTKTAFLLRNSLHFSSLQAKFTKKLGASQFVTSEIHKASKAGKKVSSGFFVKGNLVSLHVALGTVLLFLAVKEASVICIQ